MNKLAYPQKITKAKADGDRERNKESSFVCTDHEATFWVQIELPRHARLVEVVEVC